MNETMTSAQDKSWEPNETLTNQRNSVNLKTENKNIHK